MRDWDAIMKELGREPLPGRLEPTEERVKAFEGHIGVALPSAYREFLLHQGGVGVRACLTVLL